MIVTYFQMIQITQKAMAELFGVQTPAISKHLKNIFEQGELREEVVVSKMEIPTPHGTFPINRRWRKHIRNMTSSIRHSQSNLILIRWSRD